MIDGAFSLTLLKASFTTPSSSSVSSEEQKEGTSSGQAAINAAAESLSSGLLPPWSLKSNVTLDNFLTLDGNFGPSNKSGRLPTALDMSNKAIKPSTKMVDWGDLVKSPETASPVVVKDEQGDVRMMEVDTSMKREVKMEKPLDNIKEYLGSSVSSGHTRVDEDAPPPSPTDSGKCLSTK
jgi:hypothetical protein